MKDIINGINTIISNKTPSINSKRLDISNPKFAFSTIFPKRIKIGNKEKELQVLIPIALKYLTKPRASDEWKKLRFKSSWKT